MSLNATPAGERVHIGFFGLRNAGKSSLVNAVTGQELSVVSPVKGTTTDPVRKTMELLPLGPVVIIDTPGLDDSGELGQLRVQKARQMLSRIHIAVLVHDCTGPMNETEQALIRLLEERSIPYILVQNKADLAMRRDQAGLYVSALTGENVGQLKEQLAVLLREQPRQKPLIRDLLKSGDRVLLVIPIDKAAPKGRLILPQQMTIREALDCGAIVTVCRDTELAGALQSFTPRLVITDSQVFGKVSKLTPKNVPLTSFSILMARYKGDLPTLVRGAGALSALRDGSRVLISEGCTHHRQCNDIGTVKLPKWIEEFSGAKPSFSFTSGGQFPEDLTGFDLVVHCGGCMLNDREMADRIARCEDAGVPIVNYGIAIAHIHGILGRSLEPFSQEVDYG